MGGTLRFRIYFVACSIAVSGVWLYLFWPRVALGADFDLQWHAIRALLAGENAYLTVGPGTDRPFGFPYYYPLPAAFMAAPFAWLPIGWASLAFRIVSVAALAWVASRFGWRHLPMFFSGALIHAISVGQWSMLFTAGLLAPALAWIATCKPNFAAAFAFARWDRRYLLGAVLPGLALLLLAFAFVPTWPFDWLAVMSNSPDGSHTPIALQPFGFLVLFALIRWRSFEGRLLTGMSIVPQTGVMYDALPLFLVCRTQLQGWILAACSIAAYVIQLQITRVYMAEADAVTLIQQFNLYRHAFAPWLIGLMYLPALAIVLWNGRRRVTPESAATGAATSSSGSPDPAGGPGRLSRPAPSRR